MNAADGPRQRRAVRRRILQVLTERRLTMIHVAPTHQTRRQSGVSAQSVGAGEPFAQASISRTARIPTDS